MKPLVLVIEEAKAMLMQSVLNIKVNTGLPSSVLDGVICSVLADVRKDACAEISIAAQEQIDAITKNEEKEDA